MKLLVVTCTNLIYIIYNYKHIIIEIMGYIERIL